MIYTDKKGLPFEVKGFSPEDLNRLMEMYSCFSPKGSFQGMPPCDGDACCRWVETLIERGENLIAVQDKKVTGHAVLLPDGRMEDAEFLIFVSRAKRGRGMGSRLTGRALKRARKLEIKKIWLTVDAYNFRATGLYRKYDFKFSEKCGSMTERLMTLIL